MKRINYNNLLKSRRRQKFKELEVVKPWLNLIKPKPSKKTWFNTYYKLRALWEFLGYSVNDFPMLRNGPIIEPTPWMDRHHPLNRKLEYVREVIRVEYGPSWIDYEDYECGYRFITDLNEVI